MAIKKIRMRPEGTNDYADVLHPETSADVVIDTATKVTMTKAERDKLSNIEANANNYAHPGSGTNPHGTTKSDVGLGSVANYALATIAEAQAGSSNAKYMTPLRVKEFIDNLGLTYVSGTLSGTVQEVYIGFTPALVIVVSGTHIYLLHNLKDSGANHYLKGASTGTSPAYLIDGGFRMYASESGGGSSSLGVRKYFAFRA